jgi:uncharacterized sulfatase
MRPLFLLFVAAAASIPTPAAETARRPNVLFLIADDMNKTLGCYGSTIARSPNVDRLAARAVRFDRAYAQYPVCSPSRVSFLSGRRPEHTGMYGNEGTSRTPLLQNAVFLPEYFRQHGYFTARVGKVFHIGRDLPECWDVTEEGTGLAKPLYQPAELKELDLERTIITQQKDRVGAGEGNIWAMIDAPDDQLIDHKIADRAIALIAQGRASGKPFFVACGFRRPHLPRYATKDYFALFDAGSLPLPPVPPAGALLPDSKAKITDQQQREALRSYLACVALMDTQLGRVLDTLDRDRLWDNTIVVFLGDHGYLLGSRGGYWGKGLPYDEACSTALLVAAPGTRQGTASPRVVEFLDFYPTLADLCSLPTPVGVEGRSLQPLLHDPSARWNHPAYSMTAADGRPSSLAVSTERYRYIEYTSGRAAELYDLAADPHEWRNLASESAHADALAQMRSLARDYSAHFRASP